MTIIQKLNKIEEYYSIGAYKQAAKEYKELLRILNLCSYLVTIHVGKNTIADNILEHDNEIILKEDIKKLKQDINIGYLPVEYISTNEKEKLIENNAKLKKISKEKLDELKKYIEELENIKNK